MCLARTGANPVRPHMIAVNPAQTHVIVSFVASGHVLSIEADSREPIECIRTSPGAGGLRQAHMSAPSPDGILKVRQGGRSATFESIARVSNKDAQGLERADVHASTVRRKVRPRD